MGFRVFVGGFRVSCCFSKVPFTEVAYRCVRKRIFRGYAEIYEVWEAAKVNGRSNRI